MAMISPRRRPALAGAVLVASVCVSTLASRPARAGDDAKARAQKLFIEGLGDIEKGNKEAGCAKLRESLGLFAVPNTHFNVARCDENEGKIAAALDHWQRGLALIDGKDKRAKVARERIEELETRVPRLRIVVPAGQVVSTVVLDGTEMEPSALESPLRLEPGKHEIVVRAKGRQDKKHELELGEKERTEVVATPGPLEVAAVPTATATSTAKVPPPPPPPSGGWRRTAGFVAGGVGVAGFIAAGITGGVIMSQHGTITEECKDKKCSPEGDDLVQSNKTLLVANSVAWGVGIAGVGAGLALILTAPSSKTPKDEAPSAAFAPLFVPGGGGLGVTGRF
ncbi:hypothetical protein [Polyangium aurulentum]|uniref:hypothetical protein n=1 Tax=Polyangium aurulentum TaxID=2567896 RepID=UPI00146A0AB9|nr:hypothetical protein [Polyangium aurulentum]UQA56339.1 hypothetical protein E8A73_034235 [Polyangium aurulentum]